MSSNRGPRVDLRLCIAWQIASAGFFPILSCLHTLRRRLLEKIKGQICEYSRPREGFLPTLHRDILAHWWRRRGFGSLCDRTFRLQVVRLICPWRLSCPKCAVLHTGQVYANIEVDPQPYGWRSYPKLLSRLRYKTDCVTVGIPLFSHRQSMRLRIGG